MELRPATAADGEGIAAVRLAIGEAHDDSGVDPSYRQHLSDHGQLWVAADGDRVVGFAGTRDVGGARLLSDLFIDPDRHGTGIGGRLLAAVLAESSERLTFASDDPRALPLYLRAGMMPRWPLLYVEGSAGSIDAGSASPTAAEPDGIELDAATALEAALTGSARHIEYRYWLSRPGAVAIGVGDIAVGILRRTVGPGGDGGSARLEHLAVSAVADPTSVVMAMARWANVERLLAYVRGDSSLARDLLSCGFRIVDSDMAMSTRADLVPETLHVIHPGLL